MDDIQKRLQRLEDSEAIRNMIAHYGPLADSGNASGVAALWTEAGTYSVGGYSEAMGHEEIAALIQSDTHQTLMASGCAHALTAPHIELGDDEATAINYSIVFRHQQDSFSVWRVSANRWSLVRSGEGWQVHRRVNSPLTGDAVARAILSL